MDETQRALYELLGTRFVPHDFLTMAKVRNLRFNTSFSVGETLLMHCDTIRDENPQGVTTDRVMEQFVSEYPRWKKLRCETKNGTEHYAYCNAYSGESTPNINLWQYARRIGNRIELPVTVLPQTFDTFEQYRISLKQHLPSLRRCGGDVRQLSWFDQRARHHRDRLLEAMRARERATGGLERTVADAHIKTELDDVYTFFPVEPNEYVKLLQASTEGDIDGVLQYFRIL